LPKTKELGQEKDNTRRLKIEDGIDNAVLNEIRTGRFESLWLIGQGYEVISDLDLTDLHIRKLNVEVAKSLSLNWLQRFPHLETLILSGNFIDPPDYSRFSKLEDVSIQWNKGTMGLVNSNLKLKSVTLRRFRGELSQFCDITVNSVTTLGITGSIDTLVGIEKFSSLDTLSLWMTRNLRDISELSTLSKTLNS
jgi:hypothetical protein